MLLEDVSNWIVREHSAIRDMVEDSIVWNYPKEVAFSVKSAYKAIVEEELLTANSLWKKI